MAIGKLVTRPAMESTDIILCKSKKISLTDLQGMASQVNQSAQDLALAEAAKKQAEEAYKASFIKALDDFSIGIVPPSCNCTQPGKFVYTDFPELVRLKIATEQANSEYNMRLLKFGQEQSLFEKMKRGYDKQTTGGNFFITFTNGFIEFMIKLFTF